ncbi:IS3 family transposase, partial [Pseudomonas aeruginosa]|nr:IS3 family transposase [Pseudomonas aeruginosa]
MVANGYSDNILVKLFISEIVHTEDSFLLKLYYKFNFATEPQTSYIFTKLKQVIHQYIDFYNNERIKTKLKGLSPNNY